MSSDYDARRRIRGSRSKSTSLAEGTICRDYMCIKCKRPITVITKPGAISAERYIQESIYKHAGNSGRDE